MYTRNRSVPTNPNTGAQASVRANMAQAVQKWMSLSQTLRDQWATYAANVAWTNRLGDTVFLTGQQMFIRTQTVMLQVGSGDLVVAPSTYNLSNIGDITAGAPDVSAHTVALNYDNTAEWANDVAGNGGYLAVFVSREVAPTINFFKGPFLYYGGVFGDSPAPTSPFTITMPAGYFSLGNKVFIKAQAILSDGRMTTPVITESLAAVA